MWEHSLEIKVGQQVGCLLLQTFKKFVGDSGLSGHDPQELCKTIAIVHDRVRVIVGGNDLVVGLPGVEPLDFDPASTLIIFTDTTGSSLLSFAPSIGVLEGVPDREVAIILQI